jgi:hypothetical protein
LFKEISHYYSAFKKVKDEVIPVQPLKVYRGSRGIAPLILNLNAIYSAVIYRKRKI